MFSLKNKEVQAKSDPRYITNLQPMSLSPLFEQHEDGTSASSTICLLTACVIFQVITKIKDFASLVLVHRSLQYMPTDNVLFE